MLFKEIIAVYTDNNNKTHKYKMQSYCESRWYIQLLLGFKGENQHVK
jgi:hypothetical protein